MIYLDASVVVPLFVVEATSPRLDVWLATDPDICLSPWTVAEFSSALSHHQRSGRLEPVEREAAEDGLDQWLAEGVRLLDVGNDDVRAARDLLRLDPLLRTPDALHVALTERYGMTLATYDRRMADAAARIGIEVIQP
ncbi:MAG: putative nucleic acid-binding protein [Brevundimonas sp.]|uniref:type II toxin-antitoxin system VapC family toxin n=1 Tax=Brevundimonas sp. TaxID=1871086 RepID=UPI0039E63952